MQERFVLIGAGSAMFTRGLVADLIRKGEPLELVLVDIDAQALEIAERLAQKMVDAGGAQGRLQISATVDRREALAGATVVICTIGVGGRRAWEQDVFVPREFGIYQPAGDSVMPGGTSRALRMVPAMVAIAEDVQELAPQALFFNYGNPMAPVCRAVRKQTSAPMAGLCHGVFQVGGYIARALSVDVQALRYTAVGMNHLTWFTEVRVAGRDAMPQLLALAEERSADLEGAPFSWRLLQMFGAFPAVLDRHVTEFFTHFFGDGSYYGRRLGVDVYGFEGTIAYGDKIFEEMRADAFAPGPLPEDYLERLSGEHEQVVEIVDSIRTDAARIYSVNLPNAGQVPNLPSEAIIESPAVADGAGLRPILQPALASGLVGTLASRLAWVETVVDAALTGDRALVAQALVLDGAVSSLEQAIALGDALLEAQAAYLPQFA